MLLCLNKSAEHLYQTVARHRLIPASAADVPDFKFTVQK